MIIKWFAKTTQKSCNKPEENEDAFGPDLKDGSMIECDSFECALSDGATRSSFSGQFAKSLTHNFTTTSIPSVTIAQTVKNARKDWRDTFPEEDLPWHVQEKLKEGAYATLLHLKLTQHKMPDGQGSLWKVLAFGDSCIFQFRKKMAIKNLPVKKSSHFNNTPGLISSNPSSNYDFSEWVYSGDWLPGDEFVLATDALAQWIYSQLENDGTDLEKFRVKMTTKHPVFDFSEWVSQLRKNKLIRDDDCTCIWIKVL